MRSSLLRPPGNEPDGYERAIRVVCGACFGLVIGFLASRTLWYHSNTAPFVVAIVAGLAAAALANRLGDDFWHGALFFVGATIALAWIIDAVIEARVHHW